MGPTADTRTVLRYGPDASELAKRRKRVVRAFVFLAAATVGLILFIVVMGDLRRHKTAIALAEAYIARVSQRVGNQQILPLNLAFRPDDRTDELGTPRGKMEWLTRDQAWLLRQTDGRVMAAWTGPIRRRLMSNGRVAIFFEHGVFSLDWMLLDAFDRLEIEQREELERVDRDVVAKDAETGDPPAP